MKLSFLNKFTARRLLLHIIYSFGFFTCCYNTARAQAEDNIWVFGTNAGLDLNSGSPLALPGYTTFSYEGAAAISDGSGNILFYTDSTRIRNRLGMTMPNGVGLAISVPETSTQGMAICKYPGSDSLYYLFTIDADGSYPGYLRYNIIDMSLDGGNGDVIEKNVVLDSFVREKMIIVKDNGCYYWLVTYSDIDMEFHSFRITETGFEPAVISATTIPSTSIGELKISPDGTKLAMATYMSSLELADFNNSTGVVSGFMTIALSPNVAPSATTYGCGFSPASNKLYVSSNDKIFQYDLAGWPSASLIAASAYMFPFSGPYPQFRLATNGKIYFPDLISNSISVINNPDLLGPACSPIPSVMPLPGGSTLAFGLGASIVVNHNPTVSAGSNHDSVVCYADSMELEAPSGHPVYIWDNGSSGPGRTIYTSDTYWVRYGTSCDQMVDTFHITVIGDIHIYNDNPTTACWDEVIDLVADDVPGYTYEWSPASRIADPTSPVTTMIATNGTVILKVSHPGCPDVFRSFNILAIDCFPVEPIAGAIPLGDIQEGDASVNRGGFHMAAYPNPVYDHVMVKIQGQQGANATIAVCDLPGRVLKSQAATGIEIRIDMSNVAPGMYFIKYTDDLHAKTITIRK